MESSLRILAVFAALCLIARPNWASDPGESVEITILLEDGRYYSRNQVRQELNRKLGNDYPIRADTDRRMELRPSESLALRLAQTAGLLRAKITEDRIVISVPRRLESEKLERWFAVQWGLELPVDFDSRRRSVVLIHGLESGPQAMQRLARAFRSRGFQVLTFDYPNDGPIAASGDRLSENLREIRAQDRGFRVAIVGHSMGGLVARYCLETPGKNPGCVTHLVTLGTPHRGSALATAHRALEFLSNLTPRSRSDKWTTLNDGQGEAAVDLLPDSEFLKRLNGREKPPGVEYYAAAGTQGFFTAEEQRRVIENLDKVFQKWKLAGDMQAEVRAFVRAEELQTGRGDGVVTVRSALLPVATSGKRFALNHLELIELPGDRPEETELFRWIRDRLD